MNRSQTFFSERSVLGFSILIAGLCSIIYELLISTTSSYFLGDSIRQFSLTIGIYMAAMGVGSFLSKYFSENRLLQDFILIEVLLGIVGGSSVPILYAAFEGLSTSSYMLLTISLTALIGMLTGLEIPLLARIMKKHYPLHVNLANVFSLDYFGALIATLLFPFLLLPYFGVFRTSVFFGLVNIALGVIILWYFSTELKKKTINLMSTLALVLLIAFSALLWWSEPILNRWDSKTYPHKMIYSKQSPYQKIVLTQNKEEVRLYINRIIQFSSVDEYRYHESLALIPLSLLQNCEQVLVLGGGEGLLVRELLKETNIKKITVVDLDPEIFELARNHPKLQEINQNSLDDPRVETVAEDAGLFLQNTSEYYDLIIADLPDPSNEAVARLYSTYFYRLIHDRLSKDGIFATQATSPFHTQKAYWCIVKSIEESGFNWVTPYHTYVPSFGDWGFVIAAKGDKNYDQIQLKYPAQYLEDAMLQQLLYFPRDANRPKVIMPNRIDQPALLEYYLEDWQKWSKEANKK